VQEIGKDIRLRMMVASEIAPERRYRSAYRDIRGIGRIQSVRMSYHVLQSQLREYKPLKGEESR
jgi:hypothetical protein